MFGIEVDRGRREFIRTSQAEHSPPRPSPCIWPYLAAYFITTLGAFGVVIVLSDHSGDADSVERYQGLFWSHPCLSATFMLMLFSLAGMPVTAGFIGKFYAIAGGVRGGLWFLVILLLLNSVIGVYYYLRLIVRMFDVDPLPQGEVERRSRVMNHMGWAARAPLGIALLLLVLFGLYPQPFIHLLAIMFRQEVGPALGAALSHLP